MSELGNCGIYDKKMKKLFCLLTLSFLSTTSSAAGYPEDNASWLLLDKKYGRYYVIRVTMDTYTTGTATVSQTSDNWYRFPAAKNRLHKFKVSLLRGGFQLYSESFREPLIDAVFNADRSAFSGEFNDENGGAFEANLKGATDTYVPIYKICEAGAAATTAYQCTDLMDFGMNEKSCKNHPSIKKTFIDKNSCQLSLKPKKPSKPKQDATKKKDTYSEEDGWVLDACDPLPRSKRAGQKMSAKFFNDLFEPIDVVYVNGKGKLTRMMTMQTGQTRGITTYENHVFAFFLPNSKECLFTHRVVEADATSERSMLDLMVEHDLR
jgi:hypothetical protein